MSARVAHLHYWLSGVGTKDECLHSISTIFFFLLVWPYHLIYANSLRTERGLGNIEWKLLFFLLLLISSVRSDLLFADWARVFGLKPGLDTGQVKPMQAHKHQVLVTNFIIALTNGAQLVFIGKVLLICFGKNVCRQSCKKLRRDWLWLVFLRVNFSLQHVALLLKQMQNLLCSLLIV